MLLGTMSGKIPQSKRKEVNCIHISSSKDFSGEIRVGKKPTCMEWKSMAAFSRNPLPALSSRPVRESTVLLQLPAGEEPRSSQIPLENTVANVNQSLRDVPKEEGKGRFNGFFPVK